MKNFLRLTALAFVIVMILGACENTNSNQTESTATTEESTTEITTTRAKINLSEFNPNIPEGWSMYEDGSETWFDWMISEEMIINENDSVLGNFKRNMSMDEAAKFFPSEPLSENIKSIEGFLHEKTLYFDSLKLAFTSVDESPYALSSIETSSSELATPRGLHVGDDAESLLSLYGVPYYVLNNVWSYKTAQHLSVFHVTVENGIVQKICVNSVV